MTVIGLLLSYACVKKPASDITKAEWLIGNWESKTHEGSTFETWNQLNEHEYAGLSYMLNGKDTVVFENIRLVQEQGSLFYIPVVKDQNEGLPVRFEIKNISATQLIFENPQHDFPQIISYIKVGADSLVAAISGKMNGQEQKQTFSMKRVK